MDRALVPYEPPMAPLIPLSYRVRQPQRGLLDFEFDVGDVYDDEDIYESFELNEALRQQGMEAIDPRFGAGTRYYRRLHSPFQPPPPIGYAGWPGYVPPNITSQQYADRFADQTAQYFKQFAQRQYRQRTGRVLCPYFFSG